MRDPDEWFLSGAELMRAMQPDPDLLRVVVTPCSTNRTASFDRMAWLLGLGVCLLIGVAGFTAILWVMWPEEHGQHAAGTECRAGTPGAQRAELQPGWKGQDVGHGAQGARTPEACHEAR